MPDLPRCAALEAAELVILQDLRRHRDRALRRRAAARHELGREGQHRHQLRAPHLRVRRSAKPWKPGTIGRSRATSTAAEKWSDPIIWPTNGVDPIFRMPPEVWNEHRESARGRDLDITAQLFEAEADGPQHWPFPAARRAQRLYEDGAFETPIAARFYVSATAGRRARGARPLRLTTGGCATSGTA